MTASNNATTIAQRWATHCDVSLNTVYRWAKLHGWESGRAPRRDRGESKLTDDMAYMAADIIKKTERKNGKICRTSKGAISMMERNGYLEPGAISESLMNAHLRKLGVSKRNLSTPTPHMPMRSLHPNHVHQVDVSVCIQWYDRKDGKMGYRVVSSHYYKNKIKNFKALVGKKVLHRYALTDHCTGLIWVWYYNSTGETTADLIDFLYRCWTPKQDAGYAPFCGVPEILMTDRGAAIKSNAAQQLLANLGVEWSRSDKKNPRRQGQVECAHNIIETNFESDLFEQKAWDSDEMNVWVDRWARKFNASEKHTRHGHTRMSLWSTHVRDHLRLPPADFETFKLCGLSAPETRRVQKDRYITFDGRPYMINHGAYLAGDSIEVRFSPWDFPRIIVANKTRNADTLYLDPIAQDDYGFDASANVIGARDADGALIIKSRHRTMTQAAVPEMRKAREKIVADGGMKRAHEYDVPDIEYMQPHMVADEIDVPVAAPTFAVRDAVLIVKEELGGAPLDSGSIRYLNDKWDGAGTVTRQEIDSAVDEIISSAHGVRLEAVEN